MARATSSFPVPVSPSNRTEALVDATCSTRYITYFRTSLVPTIVRSVVAGSGTRDETVPVGSDGIERSKRMTSSLASLAAARRLHAVVYNASMEREAIRLDQIPTVRPWSYAVNPIVGDKIPVYPAFLTLTLHGYECIQADTRCR